MIDLAVVGGGPVGLMTAIHGRLAGLDVVVLEQRATQRDKACGEGLMPDAVRRLRDVGVEPEGVDLAGIRYVDADRQVDARFSGGAGRGVRRTALVAALGERARELDVPVLTRTVSSLQHQRDRVVVGDVAARYVAAADGLHSPLRSGLGLDRPARGPRRYGVRQHVQVEPWTDLVEVHWTPEVELYVTPVATDVVGVAVLGPRPLDLRAALRSAPELHQRLAGHPPASPVMGAGPFLQRTTGRVRGRTMLVGDAAGYVDALTGEGLRVGFALAQAAVDAVVAGDLSAYERDWHRLTRSYRVLTHGLLVAASHPVTRRRIVPAASTWPWAFGRIVDALAH